MTKLELALIYAARGYHLFPAKWSKELLRHQPLIKWGTAATNDPNIIQQWDILFPKSYFCVALQRSGLTVLDIDAKHDKDGASTLKTLELLHGPLPPTQRSTTPNEGIHIFFKGGARFGANRLGEGVDIPVMVPLPGSTTGKGQYTLVDNTLEALLPSWVPKIAGLPNEKLEDTRDVVVAEDKPVNIERAVEYLIKADPAIEGEGGNDYTYKLLCRVRDYGVSKDLCLNLTNQHFNTRCLPPWNDLELRTLVTNVYNHAIQPAGTIDATHDFDAVINPNLIQFSSAKELADGMQPPNWLIKNYFEQDTVHLLYGDSGSYKSFIVIDAGMHIALGREWNRRKTKQGSVFYLAGEGHGGISRRLKAWRVHHKQNAKVPFFVSPYALQFDQDQNTNLIIESIKAYDPHPALIIIDTLSTSIGGGDENSAKDISDFLRQINNLRSVLKCAVIVVHHTGHKAKDRPRGSYALMANVDSFGVVEKIEEGITVLRAAGKMKDGLPAPDTWFETNVVRVGVDEDLDSVTSLVLTAIEGFIEITDPKAKSLGANEAAVLTIVKNCEDENGINIKDVLNKVRRDKEAIGEKFYHQNVYSSAKSLAAKGYLRYEEGVLIGIDPETNAEWIEE